MINIMQSHEKPVRFEDHPTVRALAGRAVPDAGRLKVKGDRSLLGRFAACFPR
jgi:hypothetical protein